MSGSTTHPMIGVYKISGCLNFETRVNDFINNVPPARPSLIATARVDENGRYSITIPDTGEECLGLILFAWEDSDNDGQWLGYVPGVGWETWAGNYVYHRQGGKSGFDERSMYWQTANPASANFNY